MGYKDLFGNSQKFSNVEKPCNQSYLFYYKAKEKTPTPLPGEALVQKETVLSIPNRNYKVEAIKFKTFST